MRTRTLIIVRGLPGSAKSTLASNLAPEANFAADDFFTEPDGSYNFDPTKLWEAHQSCQTQVELAMHHDAPYIAVHNTFSKAWEAAPYFKLAEQYDYNVFIIECQNDFGNDHGVPEHTIQRMMERWEPLNRPKLPLRVLAQVRVRDLYHDWKRRLKNRFNWRF